MSSRVVYEFQLLMAFSVWQSSGSIAIKFRRGRANLAALNFSVMRFGQFPDNLDEFRPFVRRERRRAMILQNLFAHGGAGRRNNNCRDQLSPFRIRNADDARLLYTGMPA